MALQNLVFVALTRELYNSLMAKLSGLKSDLGFVITLLPEQKNKYLKVALLFSGTYVCD